MKFLEQKFTNAIVIEGQLIQFKVNKTHSEKNVVQTTETFSNKWDTVNDNQDKRKVIESSTEWFLDLYGFDSVSALKDFLSNKKFIVDAGCGLGYKTAWLAELAPHATVLGIDISESVFLAAKQYQQLPNLYFLRGDISQTRIKPNSVDFVVCDQVIMHTEDPEKTFDHLSQITKPGGDFACYVYRKKALPRELIDDYFRKASHHLSQEELWEMSAQLTELGKRLSDLNVTFESPDIPQLGIKGGTYDIQRFVYWNFLKCFWKAEWGTDMCDATNFDWYAPSNAKRFSKEEFLAMVKQNNLVVESFHEEEACYSGRFKK